MVRTPIIAGNWKMNKTTREAVKLAQQISYEFDKNFDEVEVVVCPPFIDLRQVCTVFASDRSIVQMGAQDVYWEAEGAYTGAISASMLAELPCQYCIVGHSERRGYFHETDEDIAKKVRCLLEARITPIMCCGEALEVRDAGEALEFVCAQIRAGLGGLSAAELAKCVVAYEPIWAIGTGRAATPEQAEEVCAAIRATLAELAGEEAAEKVRILYGGSMKPANAAGYLGCANIDGGLIGGAALDAKSFGDLARIARETK